MSDIPADIMRTARSLADDATCMGYTHAALDIARAILAERAVWQDRMQKLHRRVQKFEGAEESFRGSFRSWCNVLFRTQYDKEKRLHDYQSWLREIDKEWANGRAAEAEARLSDAVAAERERCAQIAEQSPQQTVRDRRQANSIAAAIRSPERAGE